MTLSDAWVTARNLIMQQTETLLVEMNRLDNENREVKRANRDFSLENDRLRDKPSVGSEGHYQKRLAEYQNTIITLTEDLRKWKEFGKLKDRAKMKVEATRDQYKAEADYWKGAAKEFKGVQDTIVSLKSLNSRQAQAWEEIQRANENLQVENQLLKDKVKRLKEILDMGIAGLKYQEQKERETGTWYRS